MEYLKLDDGISMQKFTSVILWLREKNYKEFLNFLELDWDRFTSTIERILQSHFILLWSIDDLINFKHKTFVETTLIKVLSNKVDIFTYNKKYYLNNLNIVIRTEEIVKTFENEFKIYNTAICYSDLVKLNIILDKISSRSKMKIKFI